MTLVSRREGRTLTRGDRAMSRSRALTFTAAIALLLIPLSSAHAELESDYIEPNTYWAIFGNVAIPNYGSQIGVEGNRPYTGVNDSSTAGGLRILFGYRVLPWMAWEVAADWIGGVNFSHDGGRAELNVFTGNVQIKGYPLTNLLDKVVEGRIQPYVYVAPGIIGAAGSSIQTPMHFNLGLGGGVDFWLNESWTIAADAKYTWAFGNLNKLNFATIGVGAAYHF